MKRQKNTIKQPQNEQMASRAGNFVPKKMATLLPKLVESKTLDSETLHNI